MLQTQCTYWLQLLDQTVTLILSETEAVLTLLGKSVLSSRKLLDSSKLEPKLESEQEIQRDLLLLPLDTKLSRLLGGLLKGPGEPVMDTWGRNVFWKVEVAVILRTKDVLTRAL